MADGGEAKAGGGGKRIKARKLTVSVRERFLAELAATAHVGLACAAIGVTHTAVYTRRERDPVFARAWRVALLAGYDRIEAALIRYALGEGDHAPVVNAGCETPTAGQLDVSVAMMLLDRHRRTVMEAMREGAATAFRAPRDAAEGMLLAKLKAYGKRVGAEPLPALPAPAGGDA